MEFFATFFVQDERRQREEEVLNGGSTVGLETVFAGVSYLKERQSGDLVRTPCLQGKDHIRYPHQGGRCEYPG